LGKHKLAQNYHSSMEVKISLFYYYYGKKYYSTCLG
jgi:hypothetical protein